VARRIGRAAATATRRSLTIDGGLQLIVAVPSPLTIEAYPAAHPGNSAEDRPPVPAVIGLGPRLDHRRRDPACRRGPFLP
jgi:hypothetical protein